MATACGTSFGGLEVFSTAGGLSEAGRDAEGLGAENPKARSCTADPGLQSATANWASDATRQKRYGDEAGGRLEGHALGPACNGQPLGDSPRCGLAGAATRPATPRPPPLLSALLAGRCSDSTALPPIARVRARAARPPRHSTPLADACLSHEEHPPPGGGGADGIARRCGSHAKVSSREPTWSLKVSPRSRTSPPDVGSAPLQRARANSRLGPSGEE